MYAELDVVDPRGTELFTADAAPAGFGFWGSDAISFDSSGNVVVDASIRLLHSSRINS